jgi:hypothetical protein
MACCPVEKRDSELLFQVLYLHADRSLGSIRFLCRAPKAVVLGNQ